MIRLAVRCPPEQADLVLAELTVLAPNGVEEERGPGYVEYAIYGGEGELPELGELDAVVGEGRIEVSATEIPDDWADRWRDFHKPLLVGERLWLRPSWEEPREGAIDVVVDPGQAFGTGAHPTTRLCLEFLLELEAAGEASGPLTDLGTGSGVLAIAAAKLGWGPIHAYDHEPPALEAAAVNAAANGVELTLERINLRERLPSPGADRGRQHDRADPACGRRSSDWTRPASLPRPTLVCSGSCRPSWTMRRCLRAGGPGRGRAPPGRRLGGVVAPSSLRDRVSAVLFGSIVDPGYKIVLVPAHPCGRAGVRPDVRLRVLLLGRAAVSAGDPGDPGGGAEGRQVPGQPGHGRAAAGRDRPASASDGAWDTSDVFVAVGFVAIIALFGLQHGFFQPQVRKAKELAERDLEAGDTLSPEFEALGQRIGKVGDAGRASSSS